MKEAQTYIKKYKDNKFLPSVNFEGDLLVGEEQLAEMLQEYADEQLLLYGVSGMLPLSKFKKEVEAYELEQQTHPIERTPERMRTILCATHWCKKIAERLTKP